MMSKRRELSSFSLGILIFVSAALGAFMSATLVLATIVALQPSPAHAAEDGSDELFGMLGTGYQGQSRDTIFIIDPEGKRLMVYEYKNEKLKLIAVRNLKWDSKYEEFPGRPAQQPSVKEMRDRWLKQQRARQPAPPKPKSKDGKDETRPR